MTQTSRTRSTLIILAGFLATFFLLGYLQQNIDHARTGLLSPQGISPRERLIELGGTVMLGSFKSVAATYLWHQATILKEQRKWIELEGLIYSIAKVQPTEIDVYDFLIWQMAYNIQFDAPTVVEAWKWIKRAIEFGERGIARNPNHPKAWLLYWQIGWLHSHRCAGVADARTRYFAEQVRKERGKDAYLVAADWYEKTWKAAKKSGAKGVFVAHRVSMWANCYEQLAIKAEAAGELDLMIQNRQKAIEIHELVTRDFPKYQQTEQEATTHLKKLIRQARRDADELRERQADPDKELALRLEISEEWCKALKGNPDNDENQRNVDRSADDLETLAPRLTNPKEKDKVMRRVLDIRFLAAGTQRPSPKVTDKLEAAVAPYDAMLGGITDNSELLRNKDLAKLVASARVRIVSNSPRDETRVRKAEAALQRYDSIVALLPQREQAARLPELVQYWLFLVKSTDVDIPTGRRRVRSIAEQSEKQLLSARNDVITRFAALKRLVETGADIRQQQQAAIEANMSVSIAVSSTRDSVLCWFALLKKNQAYAADAADAETHLTIIARTAETIARAAEEIFGPADDDTDQRESRTLARTAQSIWRTLHEFDPRNVLYLQNARGPAKRAP